MALLLIIIVSFLTFFDQACAEYVIHEQRDEPVDNDTARHRVRADTALPIRIALHPNENARLNAEAWLRTVSDPGSPLYGEFWSEDKVVEMFKPADDTVAAVKAWLSDNGITEVTHSHNKQWLAFDVSASKAEELFRTEYVEHVLSNGKLEVACDSYMLPEELQAYVDFVKPGIKSSTTSQQTIVGRSSLNRDRQARRQNSPEPSGFPQKPPKNPNIVERCDREATPACIRALYNFDTLDPSEPVNCNNSFGIFEEEDLYYQGDLNEFFEALTDIPIGTTPVDLSIDGGVRPPDAPRTERWKDVGGESNLDLQSALPIIYPQNATMYQVDDAHYAHAVDYGAHGLELFNDFLDAIDGSYCTYSAFGETGNDPKHDPKYPDPRPHGYKGKLQCGTFKPTNVISISYGGSELPVPAYYQRRQCNEFLKLALRGISVFVASGDSGSSCVTQPRANRQLWLPGQTVGCPWVTGVGATQIDRGNTVDDLETGAEENYAGISSGGGFSNLFDRPWYQKEAVSKYFEISKAKELSHYKNGNYRGNNGLFNVDGRGIPDISAIGTNIAVFNKGTYRGLSGTSASAPIVAALFNRIIEERIRAGKRGPLGFVNPVLYKKPEVLNDIVKGSNGVCVKHLRIFVGKQYGYNATEGWDPMTGLGTPRYSEMLKVFKDLP